MSLINDALRRAKQAHQENTPPKAPPDPHFRPVDPRTQDGSRRIGLLLPGVFVIAALLGLLLFWELSHRDNSSPSADSKGLLAVAARTPSSSEPPSTAPDSGSPRSDIPAGSNKSAAPKPVADVPSEPIAAPVAPAPVMTNTVSAVSDRGDTNRPAISEPVPPPLKLQGIVYNPRRPSALINGRVIFLGDRLREYRVQAIRRDEVVLVGAGQTNVLSLEP